MSKDKGNEDLTKQKMDRAGILPLSIVFESIKENLNSNSKERVKLGNFLVNVKSTRLRTFYLSGIHCYCCENEALFFAVERNLNSKENIPYHLNLYGKNKDGVEVLFTHDHLLARGLGGKDKVENTSTMCGPCNWKKGHLEQKIKLSKDYNEKVLLLESLNYYYDKLKENVSKKSIFKRTFY